MLNVFLSDNVNAWDGFIRLLVSVVLLLPVFYLVRGDLSWLSLLSCYFAATAMLKWDPVYGLLNLVLRILSPGTKRAKNALRPAFSW